jgi:urease accessory protein
MTACPAPRLQRSQGVARISFRRVGAETRLQGLHQSGSAKAFVHAGRTGPEVVFLNTSGGMTGGGSLS